MVPGHRALIESMFDGLTDDERTQLYVILGKLKVSTHRFAIDSSHDKNFL
jgi:hypothetical protein